jgi:hypothetical protein
MSKNPYIKFHENLSSGSMVVPCMTKLIGPLRNFANAPKKTILQGNLIVPLLPSTVQALYLRYVTTMPPVVYGRKYKIRQVDRLVGLYLYLFPSRTEQGPGFPVSTVSNNCNAYKHFT